MAKKTKQIEQGEPGAAQGKVVFNVAASVRYPEAVAGPLDAQDAARVESVMHRDVAGREAELERLRSTGSAGMAAYLRKLNAVVAELQRSLQESGPEGWKVTSVDNVGLEVDTGDGLFNITVTEGW